MSQDQTHLQLSLYTLLSSKSTSSKFFSLVWLSAWYLLLLPYCVPCSLPLFSLVPLSHSCSWVFSLHALLTINKVPFGFFCVSFHIGEPPHTPPPHSTASNPPAIWQPQRREIEMPLGRPEGEWGKSAIVLVWIFLVYECVYP